MGEKPVKDEMKGPVLAVEFCSFPESGCLLVVILLLPPPFGIREVSKVSVDCFRPVLVDGQSTVLC